MGKINSLRKGIMVLKRLTLEPFEMSALELSCELKLNRSTIHRILNNLIEEELVEQNQLNRKYRLSHGAEKIGLGYKNCQAHINTEE